MYRPHIGEVAVSRIAVLTRPMTISLGYSTADSLSLLDVECFTYRIHRGLEKRTGIKRGDHSPVAVQVVNKTVQAVNCLHR